jgi:hypothetical protein
MNLGVRHLNSSTESGKPRKKNEPRARDGTSLISAAAMQLRRSSDRTSRSRRIRIATLRPADHVHRTQNKQGHVARSCNCIADHFGCGGIKRYIGRSTFTHHRSGPNS